MNDSVDERLLEVRDLRTWFDTGGEPLRVVDGVSFDIRRGETFALLGESGCGKSMTALSLMGLVPQPAGRVVGGSIRLEDSELLALSEVRMRAVRGNRVSMIFQEPMTSLNPVLTIGEQIGESLTLHRGLRGGEARGEILRLLEAVGIPDPTRRLDDYPHNLSGGMKQRVMIAAALATEPALLIADEPTTALDVTIQAQVLGLLRELQDRTGMSILLITHDLGVVAEMADRVAVMYAGQIVEQADRAAFFAHPRHPYSARLFQALPAIDKREQSLTVIPGTVPALDAAFPGCRFEGRCELAWERCRREVPGWTKAGPHQQVRCHLVEQGTAMSVTTAAAPAPPAPGSPGRSGAPLLQVEGLRVHFPIRKGLLKRTVGHVYAVDGVSLDVPRGHTLALVGESGCGKTTVGKAILRLVEPTAGELRFDGVDLGRLTGAALRERRSEFQIIFQDPFASMNPRMLVGDIIEEGMLAQGIGADASQRRRRVEELLAQVGMPAEASDRYPHEFSGGQRQRICIARALAVNPRLIVCDEPTSALDVSVQAQILNLLKRLQIELDLSYLFITHNIAVVGYLAEEVAVMYLGRVIERGPVEAVLQAPAHPYTQALLAAVPGLEEGERGTIRPPSGELPSPISPPAGCHFHPRCEHAMPRCREAYPDLRRVGDGHAAACFLLDDSPAVSTHSRRDAMGS